MKIALLSASIVGTKTRSALTIAENYLEEHFPQHERVILDLKELSLEFSDGRNYLDYTGDTLLVTTTLMSADIIIIATPTFQASIPGTLKNIFDLLPQKAFFRKTVSFLISAGSSKHYLVGESQLKPILNYMKANVLPNYVFIEESDVIQGKIINDDVLFRIDNLMEDTIVLAETYQHLWEKQESQYDF